MTPKQFFAIARRVKWIVDSKDAVRTKYRLRRKLGGGLAAATLQLCPLAYVTGRVLQKEAWHAESNDRLPAKEFQAKIIAAADEKRGRAWLKRNLGIA